MSRTLVFLCFAMLAGQILDSVSFAAFYLYLADNSNYTEINPFVRTLLILGGPALVVAFKLAVGYRVWRAAPYIHKIKGRVPRVLLWIFLPLAAISGWVGFIFNSVAIKNTLGV
jgi:hypothetical protein